MRFINPYLIQSYFYCENKVFIEKNKINVPKHSNIDIGNMYDEDLKKVKFEGFEVDEINKKLKVIYEFKKRYSNPKGNKYQILYYLFLTKKIMKNYIGVVKYIENKIEIKYKLNKKTEKKLLDIINKIQEINDFNHKLINSNKCINCGQNDFCNI